MVWHRRLHGGLRPGRGPPAGRAADLLRGRLQRTRQLARDDGCRAGDGPANQRRSSRDPERRPGAPRSAGVIVGQGAFRYELVKGWEQIPAGWTHGDVVAVAVDSRDRVYVFSRSEHPVMVYERDGTFLG